MPLKRSRSILPPVVVLLEKYFLFEASRLLSRPPVAAWTWKQPGREVVLCHSGMYRDMPHTSYRSAGYPRIAPTTASALGVRTCVWLSPRRASCSTRASSSCFKPYLSDSTVCTCQTSVLAIRFPPTSWHEMIRAAWI
jgi:hypothetical protein